MQRYKEKDKEVADAAINSIFNHLWYLTQEVVIFSIFDAELPTNLRQDIVKQLLSFPRLNPFITGKPKFPINALNREEPINISSALVSCVGERSWQLFSLLESYGESVDWMYAPVECWEKC
jgi:hypothetical protein